MEIVFIQVLGGVNRFDRSAGVRFVGARLVVG